jgi:DNA polymerase III epsilon subunit-like protein
MTSVVFDLETGGLLMEHPVIQFAAVAVDDQWKELASIELKIQFDESQAEPKALEVNHYDAAIWKAHAIHPNEAVHKIGQFIDRFRTLQMVSARTGKPYSVAKLIGHNAASFDGPRLQKMFKDREKFLACDPRIRCTVQRALWWFDETGTKPPDNYKLETLCKYFGIPVPEGEAHDALVDVRLNVQLAKALKGEK